MRSLWPKLGEWIAAPAEAGFALATVTAVSGSAPRAPGACMAIMPDRQRFLGSVSSGCLDAEIVDAAHAALATGKTQRLRFGPDGAPPWSDGLTCGGWVEVRIEPWWGFHPRESVRALAPHVRAWLEHDESGIVVSDDDHHLAIAGDGAVAGDVNAFPEPIVAAARDHLRDDLPPCEQLDRIFFRTIRRKPHLLLVGAADVAAHLVALARTAGFVTTVIDPRAAYLVDERFSVAPERTVRSWPQAAIASARPAPGPRDAVIALTHDPKIDDPALLASLATSAGYIGALGSKRSHATRRERLREQGASAEAMQRIHGPAGLHLGTPDPAGIAAGIFAGLLQWQAAAERERLRRALAGAGSDDRHETANSH